MLDRLVLTDRPVEHVPRARVVRSLGQCNFAETDSFRRDQDALRIHAVQNVFEAAALLADAIVFRNFEIADE